MTDVLSMYNPSFSLFPVNNDRTGWKPFGLPVIMVVPYRRDTNDTPISNSQVFNVKVYIEDVPRSARVSGHDHIGLRFPDRELFSISLNSLDLTERIINLENHTFIRNNVEIPYADAVEGDKFIYTTASGVKDSITYLPSANYYDLSDIKMDFEHLPSSKYNLVYHAQYFSRIVSQDDLNEFICIDTSKVSLAIFRFNVKHPGDVIEEFERLTPPPYLTDSPRSTNSTLSLYRPFTDALQDVMDEQSLLESINWVFDTPAEAIPYLSQLLGWDLPYFPESLDGLRRAVLRRTVEFQNLAGSRRAIINLFRLFGFEILISNLWWSSDGKRLIRPDEKLPLEYKNQEIQVTERCQINTILSEHNANGFGVFEIPLIYRPQEIAGIDDFTALRDGGAVTIDCYFVENNSDAYNELISISQEILNDPTNYGDSSGGCGVDNNGFLIPIDISNRMIQHEVVGYSQILITGKLGQAVDEVLLGPEVPLKKEGVSFNRETNILNITLNGALDYEGKKGVGRCVFAFVTYKRQEFIVPDVIKHLQSNRFDIQVVTEDLIEFADPIFLEFAIDFLYKLKAFHSLLNKITFNVELNETYEVTDWCVGGNITQRFDTDAGTLQVPPAIIPQIPDSILDCSKLDPKSLGYKNDDIILRLRKLSNLPEEHAAWALMDDRADQPIGDTRLPLMNAAPGRTNCKFTHKGQDRIIGERIEQIDTELNPSPLANSSAVGFSSTLTESPIKDVNNGVFNSGINSSSNNDSSKYGSFSREFTETRSSLCELDKVTDYCYKGRVDDEVLHRSALTNIENISCKPCNISIGTGTYYLYPANSVMVVKGVSNPGLYSKTAFTIFSGKATEGNQKYYLNSVQGKYLQASYNAPLIDGSHLSRLLRDYGQPEHTLHFTNRDQSDGDQRNFLAIQRPSLNIQMATMHLPGCRFPLMRALTDDFHSQEWKAKPWDHDFSTFCGDPKYGKKPSFLNCTKVTTDGIEFLVYDDKPFQALGNGLIPDISSLGDHTLGTDALFDENDVVHKVYMANASSNPAISFEGVSDLATTDSIITTDSPLFSSHDVCNTGEIIDFADGYPSEFGMKAFDIEDINGEHNELILEALGIETSGTGIQNILLVSLSSGIKDGLGMRLDCGCSLVSCDDTSEGSSICSLSNYIDQDGEYDWDCDQLSILPIMKLEEQIGTCSNRLDGKIISMIELI